MKLHNIICKQLLAALVSLVNDTVYLLIDLGAYRLGAVISMTVIATEEHLIVGASVKNGTELLAHTVLDYHITGKLGCALDIIGSA